MSNLDTLNSDSHFVCNKVTLLFPGTRENYQKGFHLIFGVVEESLMVTPKQHYSVYDEKINIYRNKWLCRPTLSLNSLCGRVNK